MIFKIFLAMQLKNPGLALILLWCSLFLLHSCTNNFDPATDKDTAADAKNQAVPYNALVNKLQSVDQQRVQDYEMLRKKIDSSHNILSWQMHVMHDSTIAMQFANNQQLKNLRTEVHRLTNLVYAMLVIALLALGYILAEGLKKYRNRQRRIAQNISYSPVEDITPTVISDPAK